jgi:hypothetical protein
MRESREITKEELREQFLDGIRGLVNYWNRVGNTSQRDKLDGLAFSILNMIDGMSGNFPCPLKLVVEYTEEDKEYCIENGNNYPVDGMVINDSVMLHELYYENREEKTLYEQQVEYIKKLLLESKKLGEMNPDLNLKIIVANVMDKYDLSKSVAMKLVGEVISDL